VSHGPCSISVPWLVAPLETGKPRLVAEFATVDPGSFSFRYPVDTQGRPIELAHGYMDLSVLADVMEGVDGYFTGCDGYLDALASAGP